MSASAPVKTNGHRRRAAGYYLLVLSVSMILMIIGLSALSAVRIQRRGAEGGNDLGAASLYAQSAIDLGMHWIANEATWRTSRGEGFWAIEQPIGEGSFTLEANDLGTNKQLESSAATDSVLLTGTGFKGDARYKLQVTLVPDNSALTCLEVALHAGNGLLFTGGTVNCNQTISANDTVTETSSTINSDVEAVVAISGTGYTGNMTTPITPRTMPDPSTAFDFYTDPLNGTYIDVSMLPVSGGSPALRRIVLSPANNPYGPPNPKGIYVIDLLGQVLKIEECRIVGTLVLLNGASNSTTLNEINWEPAVPNYPALMVRGDFVFNTDSTQPLSEGKPANVNFNPLGTPYNGDEDTLIDDTYPTIFKGLVYVSGNASTISGTTPAFDGVVIVGNTMSVQAGLELIYQGTFLGDPPPGFAAPVQMIVSPVSWRQVVN